jgi:hypothetical protein
LRTKSTTQDVGPDQYDPVTWMYDKPTLTEQLTTYAVRSIELDIYFDPDGGENQLVNLAGVLSLLWIVEGHLGSSIMLCFLMSFVFGCTEGATPAHAGNE